MPLKLNMDTQSVSLKMPTDKRNAITLPMLALSAGEFQLSGLLDSGSNQLLSSDGQKLNVVS